MSTIQIIGIVVVSLLGLYVFYSLYNISRFDRKGNGKENNKKALSAILLFLAVALGQTAFAQTTWTLQPTASGNTITYKVKRSGDISQAVTVRYRTVGLSSYEGENFTSANGTLTFPAGIDEKTVSVTTKTPSTEAYKYYQSGAPRKYLFEVTDMGGFSLVSREDNGGAGTVFSTSYINQSVTDLVYFNYNGAIQSGSGNHYVDASHSGSSSWVKVTDAGYSQAVHNISTSSLYSNNSSTTSFRNYLNQIGYKMYATVYFSQKEEDDGYQYIQILTDNSSTYDGNDPNGAVNNPSTSKYKACFILSYDPSGSVMTSSHYQFFPHRYDYVDRAAEQAANITHYEFDYANSHLYQQKYKSTSYQATTSGSLVLDPTVNNINVRFDAAGSGQDDWYFKDLKARLALVDATKPTIRSNDEIKVADGAYGYGNMVYITIPFTEIVTVNGSPTLSTTWGTLNYIAGSGTNVLTFSGHIVANLGTALTVNSISVNANNTIKDLMGNTYVSSSINKTYSSLQVTNPWLGSGTANDPYIIMDSYQLDLLSRQVWAGNYYDGKYFKLGADITYSHSTDWNNTSSTENNFTSIGGYGQSFRGTFDGDGHSISGIRIYKTGSANTDECQGLFGLTYSGSMVKNLVLYDINIVGKNQVGVVVGSANGTIQDCYVYNSRVQANSGSSKGIINGSGSATITRAYYKDCLIGSGGSEYNIAHLTLNGGATVTRTGGTTVNAFLTTYGDGITLSSEEYYTKNTDITLGYSGTVPSGSFVKYTASASYGDITYSNINNGNVLTMPDADVTVNATLMPVVTYLDADGIAQQCSDYTVITSSDSDVNLGTSGKTHWYVVNSNATINAKLYFHGNTNLILCDGATLTVNRNGTAVIANEFDNFNIFGQTNGNGTLNAASLNNSGITSRHLGIYGGIVSASAPNGGIHAGAYSITLGYTTPANRFTASSYYCSSLIVKSGQTLTDGEGLLYSGTYTGDGLDATLAALAGKTLQPAYSLVVPTNFSVTGITAPQGFAPAGEVVTLHTDAGYTITEASYTPAGGSATAINPVEGVWSFSMPTANTTVTATRETNTYTVHFDANATNGINATGTMADQTFTYNDSQSLIANAFARTGYTFGGWNTQADGSGTAYTNQQSVNNLTTEPNGVVTLYAQWSVINWTGCGSESDPYLIIYASQLVKLADDVNSGENYWHKYFKLGNDIDMNGVAFEGIGRIFNQFSGYFNGDNRTISNLTINSQEGNIGLFVYMTGSVSNLILSGANITGRYEIGGIAGRTSGSSSISNCLVLNSNITKTGIGSIDAGVIVGNNNTNAVLTNNHYRNCSVTQGENTYTTNIGTPNGDVDGARSVHTLTLPQHVTATGETVIYNQVTYYASNVNVTLTPDQGFTLEEVTVNGTPATYNNNGTWTFTMPAADATVNCAGNVLYIDANGNQQTCSNYTTIESNQGTYGTNEYGTNAQECWFVVSGDVTINGILLKGTISHLILCDGATLTINQTNENDGLQTSNNLIIYGQSVGNGTLTVSAPWVGLNTNNDLIINGGIISATSTTTSGITAGLGNITINRGSVTARGYSDGIYGQNIFINGGIVNATNGEGSNSYGIKADLDITLGYTELTDRITSSSYKSYNGTVSVKAGQFLTDGTTAAYIGTLNNDQISALAGQTLQPCFSITLPEHVVATGVISQSGTTAYAVPGAEVTIAGASGYSITLVTFNGNNATSNPDGSYTFTMPAENVTVSCQQIDIIYYSIEYDLAGGSVNDDNPTSYSVETQTFILHNPTRAGFTFTGWTGTDLNGPTLEVTIEQGSTGDREYTAHWEADIAGNWGNGDGSQQAPYIITTTTGLNLLATLVNQGNDYQGKYFKLGNNIDYVSNATANYTAIGTETTAFAGTFDGQGYAVKNFHIENNTGYQGLFGHVAEGGTVKNTVVDNALINDNGEYVAGIAGSNEGSIENCFVINTVFSKNLAWPIASITDFLNTNISNSYYRDCTLGGTSNWSDCYTVTGGTGVTVVVNSYDYGVTYNGTLYVSGDAHLSLNLSYDNVPSGQVPVFFASSGTLTGTGNPYTFDMENYVDVTITAKLGLANVPYLDADGVQQTCPVAQLITTGNSGDPNTPVYYTGQWFVVDGNVTVHPGIRFENEAHLILKDGATLNTDEIEGRYSLNIYAQSEGDNMGVINATVVAEGLTINGGIINANQNNNSELYSNRGDLVINSGRITANLIEAKYVDHKSVVNLLLGCRNTTDFIRATNYSCPNGNVKVKEGQILIDGTNAYLGTLTSAQVTALAGQTLRSGFTITYDLAGGTVATANPDFYSPADSDITLNNPTRAGYNFKGWTGTGLTEPTMTVTIAHGSTGNRSYTATWELPQVAYIDANGETAYCSNYTILEGSTEYSQYGEDGVEAWYVVDHNVTYIGDLQFNGSANLILEDGATLTVVKGSSSFYRTMSCYETLTIYKQAGGTGAIVCTDVQIKAYNDMIVHGGNISVTTDFECIDVDDKLTINGGTLNLLTRQSTYYRTTLGAGVLEINGGDITVTNATLADNSRCIWANTAINIYGGQVRAVGKNIETGWSSIPITLGWTNPTDLIQSDGGFNSYNVSIVTGKALTDGNNNYYAGNLSLSQIASLAGKTLTPFTDLSGTYDITYHVNGGTMPNTYPTTYTFNETVVLPIPTKEDNAFAGWYENQYLEGVPVSAITAGTSLGERNFYACWKPQYTTVTYLDADGQRRNARAAVLYGTETGTLPGGIYTVPDHEDVYYSDPITFDGNTTFIIRDQSFLSFSGAGKAEEDNLVINGNLTVYGQEDGGGYLSTYNAQVAGNADIYGGQVEVAGTLTSNNGNGTITLGWTTQNNGYGVTTFNGHVVLDKAFITYSYNSQGYEQEIIPAGTVQDNSTVNNKTLYPYITKIEVSYLDADGVLQTTMATVLHSAEEATYPGGIYTVLADHVVAKGMVYFDRLRFTGDATIIIPDGGNLGVAATKKDDVYWLKADGNLTIYGQELGYGGCYLSNVTVGGNLNVYGGMGFLSNVTATNINLSWTAYGNTYNVTPKSGTVNLLKSFIADGIVIDAGNNIPHATIYNKYLYPYADAITVSYIDENGNGHTENATVLTGSETSLNGGTYTVMGTVDFDQDVSFNGDTKLIIPDASRLYFSGEYTNVTGNLSVYGQEYRTGEFSVNDITATGDIILSNIYADGSSITSGAGRNILIAGGEHYYYQLNYGNETGTVTLGYVDAENDEIYAQHYYCQVKIRDGQKLVQEYDYTKIYSGTLTDAQRAEIESEKLIAYMDITEIASLNVTGYGESTESDHWVFIASPVMGSIALDNVSNLLGNLTASGDYDYDLYRFNQSGANGEWENYVQHNSYANPFVLENSKGYLYANKHNVELQFWGALYPAASKEVALDYDANSPHAETRGWNLVGNPFNAPATLDKSYYKMNSTGTGLVAEAVSGNTAIPACTGVMVQATGEDETVLFTKSTGSKDYQETGLGTLQIALTSGSSSLIDNAIVSFNESDQLSKFYFGTQPANIYLPQNGKDYAIAYAQERAGEMPLCFKAHENGEYTLTVSITPHSSLLTPHLIDNLTGNDVDLLATPSYTFTAKTTDYASRFKLVFNGNSAEGNDDFAFIDAAGNLIVNGTGLLQVFDVLGHQLYAKQLPTPNSSLLTPNLPAGVYVLRLLTSDRERTQKLVIR